MLQYFWPHTVDIHSIVVCLYVFSATHDVSCIWSAAIIIISDNKLLWALTVDVYSNLQDSDFHSAFIEYMKNAAIIFR